MKGLKKYVSAGVLLATPLWANAAAPTYVTDALTSAQTTFQDYLTAAAPFFLGFIVTVAGLFFVGKLIKRAVK